MNFYYHRGEVLLLHVAVCERLTDEQKMALHELFAGNELNVPPKWYDTNGYEVDAEYHETLSGYIIHVQSMKHKKLSSVFSPKDPVDQYVRATSTHGLFEMVREIAPTASLVWCDVAYVSAS